MNRVTQLEKEIGDSFWKSVVALAKVYGFVCGVAAVFLLIWG